MGRKYYDTFYEGLKISGLSKNHSGYIGRNYSSRVDVKEKPPEYRLINVSFDSYSRKARLEFLQTQQYRTVERYVTRNYVKHPVYSKWKIKSKSIQKVIKLTNNELETLDTHADFLVKNFSCDIVLALNDKTLFPAWFIKRQLKEEYQRKTAMIKEYHRIVSDKYLQSIDEISKEIQEKQKETEQLKKSVDDNRKKLEKLQVKISNIHTKRESLALMILTIGICRCFLSRNRIERLNKRLSDYENEIAAAEQAIRGNTESSSKCQKDIQELEAKMVGSDCELVKKLEEEKLLFDKQLAEVKPLPDSSEVCESEFVLLKSISGLEYEKIIGCYIIRNREKNKFYVGQSKDVIKRLKQHFKGTVPKNAIFAEDYYCSSMENKEDLFEVKIIRCATKDELDSMEKSLIEEYDAWNNGYNGTSGNS